MKTINFKEFYKNVCRMYGYITCMVTDSQENRYNYSSGEFGDEMLSPFEGEKEVTEETLDENSNVASVMLENFSAETAPAEGTQDDDYMNMIRSMFAPCSKLYSVKKDGETIYILYYEC